MWNADSAVTSVCTAAGPASVRAGGAEGGRDCWWRRLESAARGGSGPVRGPDPVARYQRRCRPRRLRVRPAGAGIVRVRPVCEGSAHRPHPRRVIVAVGGLPGIWVTSVYPCTEVVWWRKETGVATDKQWEHRSGRVDVDSSYCQILWIGAWDVWFAVGRLNTGGA